jgi:hypothetical protein
LEVEGGGQAAQGVTPQGVVGPGAALSMREDAIMHRQRHYLGLDLAGELARLEDTVTQWAS